MKQQPKHVNNINHHGEHRIGMIKTTLLLTIVLTHRGKHRLGMIKTTLLLMTLSRQHVCLCWQGTKYWN